MGFNPIALGGTQGQLGSFGSNSVYINKLTTAVATHYDYEYIGSQVTENKAE